MAAAKGVRDRVWPQYVLAWAKAMDPEQTPSAADFLSMFRIEGKGGDFPRFKLNEVQDHLNAVIEDMELKGLPVRVIVLKARQFGVSTYAGGRLLSKIRSPGQKCLVMADNEDNARELYQSKVRELWRQIPKEARPDEEASSRQELVIRHGTSKVEKSKPRGDRKAGRSFIQILTAGRKRAGQSRTFQHIHLSEASSDSFTDDMLTALLNSIHDKPGTSIIIESTARGAAGPFYEMWNDAVEGKNGYVPVFFPWFAYSENRREFGSPLERAEFETSLSVEERGMMAEFGVSLEQINWYRWCLYANCRGDRLKRSAEHPSTPEEAFVSSGTCRFDHEALLRNSARAPKPVAVGFMTRVGFDGAEFVESKDRPEVVVYRKPVKGREYIIGADVGYGVGAALDYRERPDFSAAVVRDRRSRKLMARVHLRISSGRYAKILNLLGRWYEDALLVPEANGIGQNVLIELQQMDYPNIYVRREVDAVTQRVTTKMGFATVDGENETRQRAIDALASELASGRLDQCEEQIRECRNFILKQKGSGDSRRLKYEARTGSHDDEVMADAILCAVNCSEPYEEGSGDEDVDAPEPKRTEIDRMDERLWQRMRRGTPGAVDAGLGSEV